MTMPFTEDTLVQQTTAEYLRDEFGWEMADCFHEIEWAYCGSPLGWEIVPDKKSGRGQKRNLLATGPVTLRLA